MKTSLKITLIVTASILITVIVTWLAGAFNEKISPSKIDLQAEITINNQYTITSLTEDNIETATGTIQARDETSISSRILANIQSINFRAGDSISQGDLLVELDNREFRARVEQANQTIASAAANLEETQAEYERINTLYGRQVVSRSEFDRVQATLKSRQAEYERAQQLAEEAQTALSFSTIYSPIDGNVIERYAEPGDTATPGMPLLKIYNPALMRLDAQVRESLAADLKIGDKLEIHIDAVDKTYPAIIDEIVPSADPGSRSMTVRALLPMNELLYPGMFGRLLITTGTVEKIYIPADTISRMGQLEFVQVINDNNQLSRRYIRTGSMDSDNRVEVLSGLQPGEKIIAP